jgi:hypothetical protein
MDAIANPLIKSELRRAWQQSLEDDPINRHEERGYIVLNPDSSLAVERWPRGEQSRIVPPLLAADNRYNGKPVVAAFHTHPNPSVDEEGRLWEQAPSPSDRRWHGRRKLRGYVISGSHVYAVDANGSVSVLGKRDEVL